MERVTRFALVPAVWKTVMLLLTPNPLRNFDGYHDLGTQDRRLWPLGLRPRAILGYKLVAATGIEPASLGYEPTNFTRNIHRNRNKKYR